MGLNVFKSPVGPITVESLSGELISIRFKNIKAEEVYPDATTEECISQLKSYFKGELKRFTVPFRLVVTDYQERVLNEVRDIPYGKILTYGDLAKSIENIGHTRSVARVNAKNPIPIIIPCHRVIGLNGSLVGYVGGLEIKKHLLELENGNKQLKLF